MSFWENVKSNSGWADDPEWRRLVIRWSAVSLLLIGVAAWFSYGFFQWDEYYQVTEFVSHKLGKTPTADLAWEYHAQIRPWMQPAIYYVVARAAMFLGVENPFTLAFIFRALTGLCGWVAIVSMMLSARVFFADRRTRRLAVIILALLWLIPYLAVRTSSESLSGDFFTLGVAVLVLGSSCTLDQSSRHIPCAAASYGTRSVPTTLTFARRRFPIAALAMAGICFGLAFEFRFQIAFAVAGVVFWVALIGSENRRRGILNACMILACVVPPILAGTAIDYWGYGEWCLVPWNYFNLNILQHRADAFGTSPAWWYFFLMNDADEGLLAPVTLLWTAAMLITWVRRPRHLVTWVTLPFFVAHCAVAHKEIRFLFPMTLLATFFFLLAFAPDEADERQPALLRWIWERRGRWPAKVMYAANFIGLAIACLVCGRRTIEMQRFIYDKYGEGCHAYLVGEKNPYRNFGFGMYFYRPKGFVFDELKNYDELKKALHLGPPHFLLITDQISLADEQAGIASEATLVWRSYPSWLEHFNYFHWLDRARTFSMYAIDRESRPAEAIAKTATDRR
jgi:phosphatidylinositol glycan class B